MVPRQLDRVACLADGDDGDVVGSGRSGRQRLVGVVERGAGEPAHAGHRVAVADRRRRGRPAHAGELGRRLPEVVEVVDRPADQRVEVVEAVLRGEAAERGGLPGVVGRRPQDLAALHQRYQLLPRRRGWAARGRRARRAADRRRAARRGRCRCRRRRRRAP